MKNECYARFNNFDELLRDTADNYSVFYGVYAQTEKMARSRRQAWEVVGPTIQTFKIPDDSWGYTIRLSD